MASDEPGPGQQYAIQARKHISALRRARPSITIEIRWCPAHNGIAGNEKADEWAKIAAEEPDTPGVEWLNYADRDAPPTIPRQSQARDLGEEVGGGTTMGRGSDLQEEIPHAREPEARRRGGR